jgi:hypothetical protein
MMARGHHEDLDDIKATTYHLSKDMKVMKKLLEDM